MQTLVNLDFNSQARAINLLDPSSAQDAATKAYVDSAVEGLAWKDSVRVASVANITLSGPGATVDGVTMAANDRFLAKNQTTTHENGIYIWNGSAVPATRAPDMSLAAEFEQAVTTVEEGTSAGATFRQTAVNVTVGTTAIVWQNFGTSAPAASESTPGIAEIATQGEADAGTDDLRFLTPLKGKSASWTLKRFEATIGDGSATTFNIDHNFNTRDVLVEVYRNSGNYDTIIADVTRTTVNRVVITFAVAPAASAFRVLVRY